jgi:hypothetical protein
VRNSRQSDGLFFGDNRFNAAARTGLAARNTGGTTGFTVTDYQGRRALNGVKK